MYVCDSSHTVAVLDKIISTFWPTWFRSSEVLFWKNWNWSSVWETLLACWTNADLTRPWMHVNVNGYLFRQKNKCNRKPSFLYLPCSLASWALLPKAVCSNPGNPLDLMAQPVSLNYLQKKKGSDINSCAMLGHEVRSHLPHCFLLEYTDHP